MKRIQEKVKDIVEVHSYQSLRDFMADPNETLATYHFTDGTSDLMAKWMDQIGSVSNGRGAAFALAGYRGVGKSHFLAVLGWMVSTPELRSRVTDSHVSNSAQRLLRRHYPVAHVRRGTRGTLLEELKDAVSSACNLPVGELADSAGEILDAATANSGDLPFVLLIDTAFERGTRVSRDDGGFLSDVAEAAKQRNVFVGVALDDDIAGADGLNSSIVRTFTIDYLDQEHLYKVVNANIFPKQSQMQPALYDVYQYFKEVLPGFRWSEQRFLSLYPLHPVILEVAPFVRLYVHDFALLAFASAAGTRIMGRPANSLIALDEVFDSVEQGLRKIEELKEAFAAYDRLNTEVVGEIPVMQRLQAKLILKALLLLSLEGEGTTASEISAAMLIFDETDPTHAERSIKDLIKTFSDRSPDAIQVYSEPGRELRYGFKVSGKDDLNQALADASAAVSPDVVPTILKRLFLERFTDSVAADEPLKGWTDCHAVWRGGLRRGRVHIGTNAAGSSRDAESEFIDWEAVLELGNEIEPASEGSPGSSKIHWRPDELKREETEAILRYYTLSTQTDLREQFGDQLRASVHAHTIAVGKILDRVLLEDGKIVIDNFDYNFTEEARAAETLSELFSIMLEPLFETRYPEHPRFSGRLGMAEVAALVADLYSGNRQDLTEVQRLADSFALPLGLVKKESGVFVPETEEHLLKLPVVERMMSLVPANSTETVSLKEIYAEAKKAPYGLVREAQHLVLAALVAQRQIEFVTSKGDRINRRSLDLKIIWDDIVGIAKPAGSTYSAQKLLQWAILITSAEGISSIDRAEDREKLKEAFSVWLEKWRSDRILERFNEVPDEVLNAKIWRISARAAKNFGSLASTIEAMLGDSVSIDEGLHRIADAFSDSETTYANCAADILTLEYFINGVGPRDEIRTYLSLAEHTGDGEIEAIRDELIKLVDKSYFEPGETVNRELKYTWDKFRKAFGEYFAGNHDVVMRSHVLQEKFEEIKRGDRWWEFQNLSALPIFENTFWAESKALIRQLKQLDCNADVRAMLNKQPFCECSFSLGKIEYWERMPQLLSEVINSGLASYKKTITHEKANILPMIEKLAANSGESDLRAAAKNLSAKLNDETANFTFSVVDLKILQEALETKGGPAQTRVSTFDMNDIMSDEELEKELGDWVDDLPKEQALLNI